MHTHGITHCSCCRKPLKDDETVFCTACSKTIAGLPPTAKKTGCKFCNSEDFSIVIKIEQKNKKNKEWENYYDYDINWCPCCGTRLEDIDF